MLDIIAAAIKARLEEIGGFNTVAQGFSKRALQSPPSAVFFLVEDRDVPDAPMITRHLFWHIALVVSYIDQVKAQEAINGHIDAVRTAFGGWVPVPRGCRPCTVPEVRFEAVEDTLLLYTVQVAMQVVPVKIT